MKIFVITIDEDKWKKYKNNPIFCKYEGVNGKEHLTNEWIRNNYITMWNCSDSHRGNVAGCSESHLRLMKKIIDEKIDKAIIVEDDTELDIHRLSELDDIKEFCYIGGHFQPPRLDKPLKKEFISLEPGLNDIDTEIFTIAGGYGLYFPTYQCCKKIYDLIMSKKKKRAIDSEFRILQKKGIIKHFIFPAIATLHMEDAMKGFTFNHSSKYKLKDNYLNYNL